MSMLFGNTMSESPSPFRWHFNILLFYFNDTDPSIKLMYSPFHSFSRPVGVITIAVFLEIFRLGDLSHIFSELCVIVDLCFHQERRL